MAIRSGGQEREHREKMMRMRRRVILSRLKMKGLQGRQSQRNGVSQG